MSALEQRRRRIVALILHRSELAAISDEQQVSERLGYAPRADHPWTPLNATRGQVEEPMAARRNSDLGNSTG